MSSKKVRIVDIKRFAIHDGDGIRTTVFFKGCPLKCAWCHNPESIDFKPQLSFYTDKCMLCGKCEKICPNASHDIKDGIHNYLRDKCFACGKCESVCFNSALKFYGKETTVSELIPKLLDDKDFYEISGGGVTLSGGECLMHYEFCAELLKKLKENNIHTAVDTCGFVAKDAIDAVIPYTDIFLYDLKAFDEDVHMKCTGQSNKIILENLKYIASRGKAIEIRIPYIPEYNKDQIKKIAKFLSKIENITNVRVLSYHNYAVSKYASLDMENTLPKVLPKDDEIKKAVEILKQHGITAM